MSDPFDLRRLLESWPYDPEDDARIVRGDDGREVLQVRTPVGIEQLEMQGRPDGTRPHGMESALEFHRQKLEKAQAAGREADFELDAGDCAELFSEGTLYYFRYLRLFQLRRWAETVRDTARNLQAFDLVRQYAAREEDRNYLEKWRPYIVRMNAAASALMTLEQGAHEKALKIVESAIARIEALEELNDETFTFERARSVGALRELASQIQQARPVSAMERLERQLRRAIDKQEFERAAELRDQIRELKSRQPAQ
jgi:tetratricopeptide (TPR) repeat protein